jgi:small GTP-binding protein
MIARDAKVVFLGESTVGKTSIVSCFSDDGFSPEQSPTIGACFSLHEVSVGDVKVKLKVWDTAGQERFRGLAPMYYRDAHVAILVYAVDVRETLEKLSFWIEKLRSETASPPALIIVGNKTDLDREVAYDEGQNIANGAGATYCECSAKSETGISELFALAGEKAWTTMRQADVVELPKAEIGQPSGRQSSGKGCC